MIINFWRGYCGHYCFEEAVAGYSPMRHCGSVARDGTVALREFADHFDTHSFRSAHPFETNLQPRCSRFKSRSGEGNTRDIAYTLFLLSLRHTELHTSNLF